jgi:hypothetical protein
LLARETFLGRCGTWWNPRQAWPCCMSLFCMAGIIQFLYYFSFPCCTLFSCGMLGHKGDNCLCWFFVARDSTLLSVAFPIHLCFAQQWQV